MIIFNEIKLVGNLGADCEIKYTKGGTYFLNFSICHNESKKNENGEWEKHNSWWINCVAYGEDAAKNESMLTKGKRVQVSGRLTIGGWTSGDGKQHKFPKIIVKSVESV